MDGHSAGHAPEALVQSTPDSHYSHKPDVKNILLMTEEKLKLKRVTGGKYHRSSLVFHFEKDDLNHEFQIKMIHSNSLNLRLV